MVKNIGVTDIHCHIIPAVDDGAQSMKEAQEMIRLAYESGTKNIIATPHYGTGRVRVPSKTIVSNYRKLLAWTEENYPEMGLYLGRELSYRQDMGERLKSGAAWTLADSHYALVEFRPEDRFSRIRDGLQCVQMAGYWPILAHAERCECLVQNMEYIEELVNMGVYIQVNASSVLGGNGRQCKNCTKKLLKQEWIHFVASDGHDTKKRPPVVRKAIAYIAKHYGKRYAAKIAIMNPRKILQDKDLGGYR